MNNEQHVLDTEEEITKTALIILSSFKNGYGKDELLSDDLEKYWNSDGKAPHFLNIKFKNSTRISEIRINLNYEKDESYTPNRIILRAGYDEYNLVQIFEYDIVKPKGWISYSVSTDQEDISAFFFQIIFPYNYLNGKDLRIRGLKLFAKRELMEDFASFCNLDNDNESTLYTEQFRRQPILR